MKKIIHLFLTVALLFVMGVSAYSSDNQGAFNNGINAVLVQSESPPTILNMNEPQSGTINATTDEANAEMVLQQTGRSWKNKDGTSLLKESYTKKNQQSENFQYSEKNQNLPRGQMCSLTRTYSKRE